MLRRTGSRFRGIRFSGGPTFESSSSVLEAAHDTISTPQTIVYVHGIGNKPIASVLKRQWDDALFGMDLGQRSRMAYWVNRDYYPIPWSNDVPEGQRPPLPEPDTLAVNLHASEALGTTLDPAIYEEANSLASGKRQEKLMAIGRAMQQSQLSAQAEARFQSPRESSDFSAQVLPTRLLRHIVTRNITRAFLRDVNDFLYDAEQRQRMERSFEERLQTGGPFVVVAHSQGSLIAYNVLSRLPRDQFDVRLWVTIGSPLGIQEVQDELLKIVGQSRLEIPACVARWVNVADRLDPVAADITLAEDFPPRDGVAVEDHHRLFLNPDSPRHPHSGTGYLKTPIVRKCVQDVVGPKFAAPVTAFTVSRDVAEAIENHLPHQLMNVLIELRQVEGVQGLAGQRERVVGVLKSLDDFNEQTAELEKLERYVAVRLTRNQIEKLAASLTSLKLGRIWRNAEKMALIVDSCNTVNVRPAWQSFRAFGERICWAVLDTGIAAKHPHFQGLNNKPVVAAQYDCTKWSLEGNVSSYKGNDANGHGTHVSGIIAGRMELPRRGEQVILSGMAPLATLVGYKVLDDDGLGRDSWIIKALQHIAATNEKSAELVIHGINLSLGGNFDPTVYACGHSPLCKELRRLWRQGVLICIAAGNRGLTEIQTRDGFLQANLDLSIGDPANLDEAIAVGSVHKLNPFTFGISFFSSRGPTADGRIKPDVIAPGERILSANSRFLSAQSTDINDLYVEQSGTSMAAPHISGMLACFLSLRREFVGYPEQVKRILLDSCAPLGRDPYSQGRGLPSLMKMLSSA